ncbi:hypothetical protein SCLARK_001275 [Spiroplasma clarkii]|uniref:Uncharacterized protein n=1 Tax=Spiroplasma clarkii TaxID=2139 RepID=A0A1Y0L260_9MOLU|nr:hypothetical protein [Spiroplasma clarkii]ARU91815.1 hypothetical protein SCLARK_001275 [Spiroplasma clarkii]ATX71180.1 hypothetical protein SCLAR_v1c08720 [Spiroplasma clarkii]
MNKIIKYWRYSIAVLFFTLLFGFVMVKYGYLNGQFYGNISTYYVGLVIMLVAWLVIEICLAKEALQKFAIPTAIVLCLTATILINGYLAMIGGMLLTVDISMWYLLTNKKFTTKKQTKTEERD